MARQDFCPSTGLTCSTWNASFRQLTRASHSPTGGSTRPRQTSLSSIFLAFPIRLAPSSSAPPTRCGSGQPTEFRGLVADPYSAQGQRRPAFALRPKRSLLATPATCTDGSGVWKAIRTGQHTAVLAVPFPAYIRPREIRCSLCFTVTSIDFGQSGSDSLAALIRHWRRPTTARQARLATTCLTQCGRGTGSPPAHVPQRPPVARWQGRQVSTRRGHNPRCRTAWITRVPSRVSPVWDSTTMM